MIKILIGLVALGVVVVVHELGHFFAARLLGVEVETFSVGWGPVLLRKKIGSTEYRISALPIGGYCGMKGERAFAEALEKNLDSIPREKGTFYGAHPLARALIAFAGPAANVLFAVVALSVVSAMGSTYRTYENRIVPVSAYEKSAVAPVDEAGLLEGDRIISFNGIPVKNFSDIQQFVGTHPNERITTVYERDGTMRTTVITPQLDKKTGGGKIGVYPYIPLVIGSVQKDSAADTAGLRVGDSVIDVNGNPVSHYAQLAGLLSDKPEQMRVTVARGAQTFDATIVLVYRNGGVPSSGIEWQTVEVTEKGTDLAGSVKHGVAETGKTLELTVKSIALLFHGVDVTEAVSGPVRITMMLGEVAEYSLSGLGELLAIICVSLFLMNLLPIPILDGGTILFAAIELISRRSPKPKTLYYVQFIGIAFILFLFAFALFGDIKYLTK